MHMKSWMNVLLTWTLQCLKPMRLARPSSDRTQKNGMASSSGSRCRQQQVQEASAAAPSSPSLLSEAAPLHCPSTEISQPPPPSLSCIWHAEFQGCCGCITIRAQSPPIIRFFWMSVCQFFMSSPVRSIPKLCRSWQISFSIHSFLPRIHLPPHTVSQRT